MGSKHHKKNCPLQKVDQSSPKFFRGCYCTKRPIMQNFVAISKKCRRYIRDRKFVLPEKVDQFFRGCYPLRPPIMPNYIEISQTSLEIGGCQLGLGQKNLFCHGRTETWLLESRFAAVREARLKMNITDLCLQLSTIYLWFWLLVFTFFSIFKCKNIIFRCVLY